MLMLLRFLFGICMQNLRCCLEVNTYMVKGPVPAAIPCAYWLTSVAHTFADASISCVTIILSFQNVRYAPYVDRLVRADSLAYWVPGGASLYTHLIATTPWFVQPYNYPYGL